jgi:hypothetical protein
LQVGFVIAKIIWGQPMRVALLFIFAANPLQPCSRREVDPKGSVAQGFAQWGTLGSTQITSLASLL